MKRNNVEYTEVLLDKMSQEDGNEVGNCVYGSTPRRFVPIVYLDNQKLGGYQELFNLHQGGKLKTQD